jgi:hypothetical protein
MADRLTFQPERRYAVPARRVLLDEFHLSILAPRKLEAVELRTVRRLLRSREFQGRMRRALETLLRSYPAARRLRIRVSR